MWNSRKGFLFWPFYLLFLVFVFYTIVLAAILIACSTPLQLVSSKIFRRVAEFFVWCCWPFWVWAVEILGDNKVTFYGDDVPKGENALVITNHTSYADWIAVFCFASRKDRIANIKMQVKNSIKYIPFVGLALNGMGFMFLTRNWADDHSTLKRTFTNLRSSGIPFWIVSHPEGSRANQQKLEESRNFAKKRDLPILNHLLLPRVKGFISTITQLNSNPLNPSASIDAVYDLTIAYSQRPPNPILYLSGVNPIEVHIFVRRYEIQSLPKDEIGLSSWLYKVFAEKDQLLEDFHKNKTFSKSKLIPHQHFDPMFPTKACIWLFGFVAPSLLGLYVILAPSSSQIDDNWY